MSEHAHHDAHAPHAGEHAHPTAGKYVAIAIILTIITVIEVAVFYVSSLHAFLPPILLTLSAIKFGVVAGYYMHLRFDPKMYSWVFYVPMAFALAITLALLWLTAAQRG